MQQAKKAYRVMLLGGGNSAGYFARTFIEKGGLGGDLCIITDEAAVSYERPALTKPYLAVQNPARLPGFHSCVGGGGARQESGWYAEKGITYMTGVRVSGVDLSAKECTTEGGEKIGFEKLVIATGARPMTLKDFKTPGAELKGLHYIRDVKDTDDFLADMAACKEAGKTHAVVIGGGYIGLECACGLLNHGMKVTLIFPESRFMERLFTPELATFYEEFYSKKGATIMKGRLVKALKPGADGSRAEVAVLDDGSEVKGDLFVGGTGAKPNGELFAGQLETDRGAVKVDGFMQSSVKNVLAIGDVAAFPLKRYGGTISQQQHVTHCRLSAAHAASVILEGPEKTGEYDYLPFFYSRVFNLSWQFYGVNEGTPVFFSHSQDPSAPKFGSFWVKDGKIVGTFLEGGAPEENTACKNAVAEGKAAPSADTIAKDGIKSIA